MSFDLTWNRERSLRCFLTGRLRNTPSRWCTPNTATSRPRCVFSWTGSASSFNETRSFSSAEGDGYTGPDHARMLTSPRELPSDSTHQLAELRVGSQTREGGLAS